MNILRLPRIPAYLRDQQIHTERRILVFQEPLEFCDLLPEHVRRVAHPTDDAEAAGIGDCGGKFGAGGDVHTGEHDGVVDFEEVGHGGAELFWRMG